MGQCHGKEKPISFGRPCKDIRHCNQRICIQVQYMIYSSAFVIPLSSPQGLLYIIFINFPVFCFHAGSQVETPTLLPAGAAVREGTADIPAPTPIERSPQQRPRSGRRPVLSHPVHISSDSSFESELGPLGRSLEAGPLKVRVRCRRLSHLCTCLLVSIHPSIHLTWEPSK